MSKQKQYFYLGLVALLGFIIGFTIRTPKVNNLSSELDRCGEIVTQQIDSIQRYQGLIIESKGNTQTLDSLNTLLNYYKNRRVNNVVSSTPQINTTIEVDALVDTVRNKLNRQF